MSITESEKWNKIRERERNVEIRRQSKQVMPLIGKLLDAWDEIPNDTKYDEEFEKLADIISQIDSAMEGEYE
jgi:hypothetical protein